MAGLQRCGRGWFCLLPEFSFSLSPTRKETFYRQKGKKRVHSCFLKGLRLLMRVWPLSLGPNGPDPLLPRPHPRLYFLTWSHLRVVTEVLKCFGAKRQATRIPPNTLDGKYTSPPRTVPPYKTPNLGDDPPSSPLWGDCAQETWS